MDALDFLFEAVKNSLEAGATQVELAVERSHGTVQVTCTDDGAWSADGDVFARGYSTKGEGRGEALHLLRQLDGDAGLERYADHSVLSYSFPEDMMSEASQVYPFLFSMCRSRGVRLVLKSEGMVLTDQDMASRFGDLETAEGIMGMKRFIASSIDNEK